VAGFAWIGWQLSHRNRWQLSAEYAPLNQNQKTTNQTRVEEDAQSIFSTCGSGALQHPGLDLFARDHPGHMTTAAIAFAEIEQARPDLIDRVRPRSDVGSRSML